jgi:hypothetical protein
MKKSIFLFAFTLLIACTKSSDGNNPTNPILGRWNFTTEVQWHKIGDTMYKDTFPEPDNYLNFESNGNLIVSPYFNNGVTVDSVPYYLTGTMLYCSEFPDSSVIQLVNNNLTIYSGPPPGNTNPIDSDEIIWWHFKR